ncbi:MAG: Maf family protein [Parvularculaceae bacterium]
MSGAPLILASASPRRRALLEQIGVRPDEIIAADIDESIEPGEMPRAYALRVAQAKAGAIATMEAGVFVLAADTVVAAGRRILPKAEDEDTARAFLRLLSGRSHMVYTGLALAAPGDTLRTRIVGTRVKVRRLNNADIRAYLASGEWRDKAGAYAIQGLFGAHVAGIVGSYSNVVGLPLYETWNLLMGAGWRPNAS